MNGWKGLSTKYTGLRAMGSYSGNIAYCIEPGTGQRTGDTLTEKDENFFNNISPNGTISGDDIRLLIGRILQYGYRGGISTSWKSQNESDANCIAHAYATQILIWETIVGERDASFNHVSTGGYNAVLECVSSAHPLRSKILSYYNSMVTSVQNHTKVPSFCTRSSGSAKVNELEWNGSKYVATLTDTNGVLGNYNFSANIDGVSFSVSGNKLTVSMDKAPSKELAGFDTLRCEVVELNRDEATILMVESNYQRSQILPSEKAFAYKMRSEAMKRQAGRPSKDNSSPVGIDLRGKQSLDLMSEECGDSRNQIHRYIRLTNLVPELLDYVDEGRIKMRPAVELSFLDEDSQRDVVDEIDLNDATPSHDQTIRMRKFFEEGKLTTEAIQAIMSEEKPNQREKIVLRGDRVRQLIPKNIPISQTEDFVCKALEHYNKFLRSRADRDSR